MGADRDKILIIDDDKLLRTMMADIFGTDFDVETAEHGEAALEILGERSFAAVVSDHMMPGATGVEVLEKCISIQPAAVRILVTASEDMKDAQDAINVARVHRFIVKPVREIEVVSTVKSAIRESRLEEENKRLMGELKDAVGQLQEREVELERELKLRTEELKEVMQQLMGS